MDFEQRLQNAIRRGKQKCEEKARQEAAQALSEEELRRLHSQYRLQLSEHVERCLKQLALQFPGFKFETIYGERGWGGACSRDDLLVDRGRRDSTYSRLELTVRPFSDYQVLDITAKGTVNNKEILQRNYFEKVTEADPEKFVQLIDTWVLEYAELYAANSG